MRLKPLATLAFCLALGLAPGLSAPAAQAAQYRIMTENYPPYNYKDGEFLTGLSTEIVQEMLRRLEHPQEIDILPWSRAYKYIMERDNQALFSMSRTAAREDLFQWVGPLVTYSVVLFARKDSGIQPTEDVKALLGYTVGATQNTPSTKMLEDLGFAEVQMVADSMHNPQKLAARRIDLWVSGELAGIYKVKQAGLDPADFQVVHRARSEDLYIALSKSAPAEDLAAWQVALDSIKADGTYDEILRKYLQ